MNAIEGDDWGGKPWMMMVFAVGDGRELVLVALQGAERPPAPDYPADVRHYAFAVESSAELSAWRDRLSAAHVEFWEEDHGDQKSLYFADPNGVVLEVTAPPSRPASEPSPGAREAAQRWISRSAGALTR